jgi:hypothetical protein
MLLDTVDETRQDDLSELSICLVVEGILGVCDVVGVVVPSMVSSVL